MKIRTEINDFYDLSSCCDDDIEIVALLVLLLELKPTQKMINELVSFKLTKYNEDINLLLDEMKISTIRNIIKVRELKKEQLECVSIQLTK